MAKSDSTRDPSDGDGDKQPEDPHIDELRTSLSAVSDRNGEREVYEAFLQEHPEAWEIHVELAWTLFNNNAETDAIAHLEKLDGLQDLSGVVVSNLATFYMLRSRWREALEQLERVPEAHPIRRALIWHDALADVYEDLGWHALAYRERNDQKLKQVSRSTVDQWKFYRTRWRRYVAAGGPISALRDAKQEDEGRARRRWISWRENAAILESSEFSIRHVVAVKARLAVENYNLAFANLSVKNERYSQRVRFAFLWVVPFLVVASFFGYETVVIGLTPSESLLRSSVFLLIAIVLYGVELTSRRLPTAGVLLASGLSFFVLLAAVGIVAVSSGIATSWQNSVGTALIVTAVYGAVTYIVVRVPDYSYVRSLRALRRRYHLAAVLDPLIDLYADIKDASEASDSGRLNNWLQLTETSAQRIEREFRDGFSIVGDPKTGEWLATRAAGAAEALRATKRKMLVMKSGNLGSVKRDVRSALEAITSGNYGDMAWMNPPAKPTSPPLKNRVAEVGRIILLLLLPGAAVIGIGYTGEIDSAVLSWAKIAAAGWFFLYLAVTLDPAIRDKVELARSVAGLVQGRGEQSDKNPSQ